MVTSSLKSALQPAASISSTQFCSRRQRPRMARLLNTWKSCSLSSPLSLSLAAEDETQLTAPAAAAPFAVLPYNFDIDIDAFFYHSDSTRVLTNALSASCTISLTRSTVPFNEYCSKAVAKVPNKWTLSTLALPPFVLHAVRMDIAFLRNKSSSSCVLTDLLPRRQVRHHLLDAFLLRALEKAARHSCVVERRFCPLVTTCTARHTRLALKVVCVVVSEVQLVPVGIQPTSRITQLTRLCEDF